MTEAAAPIVTVVVPARNEAASIEACIRHVAAQDFPHELIQVLVVDGASTDATAELAEKAFAGADFGSAQVLNNPSGTTPTSLNTGLAAAAGDYLCRVDARSFVPPHYVRRCVEVLRGSPRIAVVGGAQIATAGHCSTAEERGIARALGNPYTTGFARYRRRRSSGPADTVYLGSFRTEQLRSVGGWDERLLTNQDYELNRRMQRLGTVWFESGLEVAYRPRRTLTALLSQYRRFGRWKALGWREVGVPMSGRHVVLLAAPPAAAGLVLFGLRRRPAAAAAAVVVSAALLDAAGGDQAPPRERVWSIAATAAIGLAWWAGVVEQLVRDGVRRLWRSL